MRIKVSKLDIFWSFAGTILSMSSNLIILPFLMMYLDDSTLGLWYVFASIGSIAILFDMGFAVTFARNITYCWSGAKKLQKESVFFADSDEPDYYVIKKVINTCKFIYIVISLIALILMLSAGTFYIIFVSKEINGHEKIIAWLIYSFAVFLNLLFGYYGSFLRGVGAVDKVNIDIVISKSIQVALTIVLLVAGVGIIGASIAYLSYGFCFRLLGRFFFYRQNNLKQKLKEVKQKVPFSEIRKTFSIVWHNAWKDGVISISNYLSNQGSTLVCSAYLPLSETGVYSIGVQLATAVSQIASTLYSTYQPELQSAYVLKDKKNIQRAMSIIVMSFVYLFFIGTIGACLAGVPLLKLIKPSAVVSIPVFLGLSFYQFILKYRDCYASYFSSTNRIIYLWSFVVFSALGVGLSIVALAVLNLGVWGLIAAQIISQLIYNVWRYSYLAHKEMSISYVRLFALGTKESFLVIKSFFVRKKNGTA